MQIVLRRAFLQCDVVSCAFPQCVDCRLFFPGGVDRARHTGPPPFSDRSIVNLTINCNLFICDRSSKGPIWSSLCLLFPPLAERKVRPTLSSFFDQPSCRVAAHWSTYVKQYKPVRLDGILEQVLFSYSSSSALYPCD